MARLQLDLPPPPSPSLCLTLLRFWVPLFGFLMKCHAVQVQLVFYGARSLKAAPMCSAKIDFYYFSLILLLLPLHLLLLSRLPSAVCTVSEIDI